MTDAAIAYLRVSTAEQVAGFGLDVQAQAIDAYCASAGLRLVGTYRDEGISGSNGLETRVGLGEALAALEAGDATCLVVYRMDRLARDLLLQETVVQRLTQRAVAVRSASEPDMDTLSDDPTKTLIRQIVGAIAQYERAVIRGRMQAGIRAKAAAGGYVGGQPPYGWRAQRGELVEHPAEQAAVAFARQLRSEGCTLRVVAARLAEAGYPPRRGSRWHPSAVAALVRVEG